MRVFVFMVWVSTNRYKRCSSVLVADVQNHYAPDIKTSLPSSNFVTAKHANGLTIILCCVCFRCLV